MKIRKKSWAHPSEIWNVRFCALIFLLAPALKGGRKISQPDWVHNNKYISAMGIEDKVSMFFGAKPDLFEKAAQLRENPTRAEKILWNVMKDSKRVGVKFRRQHPIDIFIADFYCHLLRLVVEVDGGYHSSSDQKEYDIGREAELLYLGIRTIRFTNEEVINDLERVIHEIENEVSKFKEK